MLRVGLLSDTHGLIPEQIYRFFENCDEVWHAGDWGDVKTYEALSLFKPTKSVYGNIDNKELRLLMPQDLFFIASDLKVVITHIGGYPGNYNGHAKKLISQYQPDIFITGHSHILKIIRDKENNLLHFNPGAAGIKGFHTLSTAIRFTINKKIISDVEVWEGNLKKIVGQNT